MEYTVYTTSTGEIVSIGSSNVSNVSDIGVSIIPGKPKLFVLLLYKLSWLFENAKS